MIQWTDDKIEALTRLHRDRLTFSQIASALSREFSEYITRNAAIGKAKRLGLLDELQTDRPRRAKNSPRTKPSSRPHPGNIRRKAQARKREAKRDVAPMPPPVPVTAPIIAPTRFADLKPNQCRWCIEDAYAPSGPDMACCGAPVVDRFAPEGKREATHCRFHFNAGAGDGTASERAAHKGVAS